MPNLCLKETSDAAHTGELDQGGGRQEREDAEAADICSRDPGEEELGGCSPSVGHHTHHKAHTDFQVALAPQVDTENAMCRGILLRVRKVSQRESQTQVEKAPLLPEVSCGQCAFCSGEWEGWVWPPSLNNKLKIIKNQQIFIGNQENCCP